MVTTSILITTYVREFSYVFLPLIADMTTTLLPSVLLLVHSTSYSANNNKQVWYYGDNDFLIQTIAHLDAVCMS